MISLGRWPGDPGRKPKSLTKNNEYLNDKNNNSFIAGPADDAVPVSTHALVQYGQHMDITATAWNLVPPNPVSTFGAHLFGLPAGHYDEPLPQSENSRLSFNKICSTRSSACSSVSVVA